MSQTPRHLIEPARQPRRFFLNYLNGSVFGNFTIPIGNGNNLETIDVPLCDGDLFEIEYVEAAQNGNNWYEVLDSQGTQIFTDGPNPFNGVAYSAPAVCDAGNTNPLIDLNAGSYPVEITDANGCVLMDTFTVNNITIGGFDIASFIVTDENCADGSGAIDITVTGGTLPYTFENMRVWRSLWGAWTTSCMS